MDFWYRFLKCVLRFYVSVCMRNMKLIGQENFIAGPKILVANHSNVTDSFVLPFLLPEKLHFLMQANLFSIPILGFALKKANQIPVEKGRGKIALNKALELLSQGKTVVIFPEGKLNHGKGLHMAGSGVAVLAKKSSAPVIPIGFYVPPHDIAVIKQRVNGRETFGCWQVRGCCYVCVGKPWYAAKTLDEKPDLSLRQITGQIMAQVAELVQQAQNDAKNLPRPTRPQLGLNAHAPQSDRKMI